MLQIVIANVAPARDGDARDVARLAARLARLLAAFGWATKLACVQPDDEDDAKARLRQVLRALLAEDAGAKRAGDRGGGRARASWADGAEVEWLLSQPAPAPALLFRMRATLARLRACGALHSDGFKFAEERLDA